MLFRNWILQGSSFYTVTLNIVFDKQPLSISENGALQINHLPLEKGLYFLFIY